MDRKALTRAYKASRRPMGVYCVRNLETGEALIGHSVDLPSILNPESTPDFNPTDDLVLLDAMWRERMQANGQGSYSTRSSLNGA